MDDLVNSPKSNGKYYLYLLELVEYVMFMIYKLNQG